MLWEVNLGAAPAETAAFKVELAVAEGEGVAAPLAATAEEFSVLTRAGVSMASMSLDWAGVTIGELSVGGRLRHETGEVAAPLPQWPTYC